jgi:hypothetical protein
LLGWRAFYGLPVTPQPTGFFKLMLGILSVALGGFLLQPFQLDWLNICGAILACRATLAASGAMITDKAVAFAPETQDPTLAVSR